MKYLLFIIFLCIAPLSYGQRSITLFYPYDDIKSLDKDTSFYEVDGAQVTSLMKSNLSSFELVIPTTNINVTMKQVNIFSSQFKVMTDDKHTSYYPQSLYRIYQAVGKEEIYTLVLHKDKIGLFYSDDKGNHEIVKMDNGLYRHTVSMITMDKDWTCDVVPSSEENVHGHQLRNMPSNECVDVYFEIDNAQYNKTKGNVPAQYIQSTTDWLISLVAQVNIQYNRVGIPLKISGVKIYTTLDPYAVHTTTSNTLYAFSDSMRRQGFNGRLAHLLVGRGIGGGVAFLNTLCSNFSNMAVSGNLNAGVTGYPNYSWNVMVVTHELGHNFGSNHTHDCVWNGNNTAIDGCQNPTGCPDIPNPPNGGTIMSYCHLQSVGINLALGFGPQPGALIFNRFENATCTLSNNCSGTPPINDICVTAKNLPANRTCLIYPADNLDANPSSGMSNSTCVNGANFKDVWFTSTVGANGHLTIETKQVTGGLYNMVLEVFTGNCDALTIYACDDNSGEYDHAQIVISDTALINDVVYIRAIAQSDSTGKFGICITSSDIPCDTITAHRFEAIYNALDGANWTNKAGWANAASGNCDYCTWYGIYCNYQGTVDSLILPNNNLSDTLLASLQLPITLKKLDLSNNTIRGTIPGQWLSLTKLTELNLAHNELNDTIPNVYQKYKSLRKLDLNHNQFHGYLPPYVGYLTSFNYFDASFNNLSGCFEPSLLNMKNKYLNLTNNASLPVNGSTAQFFIDSTGNDADLDHFCFKMNDCNDNNATVYNGAPELCDLIDNDCDTLIDEGLALENYFISASGSWNDDASWSLGHKPKLCEKVIIGNGSSPSLSEIPTQTGFSCRALLVRMGSEVKINANGNLSIRAGNVQNLGTVKNFGFISMFVEGAGKPDTAVINEGIWMNELNAGLYVNSFTKMGLFNQTGSYLSNKGTISLSLFNTPIVSFGMINRSTIDNFGSINMYGNSVNEFIKLENGAVIDNKPGGKINLSKSTAGGN